MAIGLKVKADRNKMKLKWYPTLHNRNPNVRHTVVISKYERKRTF